ncbi:IS3 family transposase [Bacteroides cellulosilyticus]
MNFEQLLNKRIKSRLKGKSPVQYRTLSITG